MQTWDLGTRRIYENLSAGFRDKIYLGRPVRKVYREAARVVVEDEEGVRETFDEVVFACNANQTLAMLDEPTFLERYVLSSSTLRRLAPRPRGCPLRRLRCCLTTRRSRWKRGATTSSSTARSLDNYEITYIMHNQQPWAGGSDKPCLVTYNAASPIDEGKVIREADVPARRP